MADQTLPRDAFSVRLRELRDNPGAFEARSSVDVSDEYGNTETWTVQTFRAEGRDTVFLQRSSTDPFRLLVPPAVAAVLASQRDRLVTQARRRAARQGLATRVERGDRIGNPDALRKARTAPRKPRRRKAVR